jgi:hypothetical protein
MYLAESHLRFDDGEHETALGLLATWADLDRQEDQQKKIN